MGTDLLVIGIGAAWGALLGLFFFGGLWWSLQGISRKKHPRRFLGLSFLVRSLMVLGGVWLALNHSIMAFFATLASFTLMRLILTRRLGLGKGGPSRVH